MFHRLSDSTAGEPGAGARASCGSSTPWPIRAPSPALSPPIAQPASSRASTTTSRTTAPRRERPILIPRVLSVLGSRHSLCLGPAPVRRRRPGGRRPDPAPRDPCTAWYRRRTCSSSVQRPPVWHVGGGAPTRIAGAGYAGHATSSPHQRRPPRQPCGRERRGPHVDRRRRAPGRDRLPPARCRLARGARPPRSRCRTGVQAGRTPVGPGRDGRPRSGLGGGDRAGGTA